MTSHTLVSRKTEGNPAYFRPPPLSSCPKRSKRETVTAPPPHLLPCTSTRREEKMTFCNPSSEPRTHSQTGGVSWSPMKRERGVPFTNPPLFLRLLLKWAFAQECGGGVPFLPHRLAIKNALRAPLFLRLSPKSGGKHRRPRCSRGGSDKAKKNCATKKKPARFPLTAVKERGARDDKGGKKIAMPEADPLSLSSAKRADGGGGGGGGGRLGGPFPASSPSLPFPKPEKRK